MEAAGYAHEQALGGVPGECPPRSAGIDVTQSKFRSLTPREREILARLLESPFPGRDEIRQQIKDSLVREIAEYDDAYGSIEFNVQANARATVAQRVLVEAMADDEDGVPILVLLHVVDGFIDELEILRADGLPIIKMPNASELEVTDVRAG